MSSETLRYLCMRLVSQSMHKTTVPYIYKDNIKWLVNEFLKEFDVKYPNVSLKMLIVGGSALAIKYGIRGTVDIDADIKNRKGYKEVNKKCCR